MAEYEIRSLKGSDFGTICKIISDVGAKQFKDCFNVKEAKGKDANDIGLEVVLDIASVVMSNMPKAEKSIQNFLSDITGMPVHDIREMPFADYGELVLTVMMKDDFKDFFGRAMKLFNL